jgi:hypothetical protein
LREMTASMTSSPTSPDSKLFSARPQPIAEPESTPETEACSAKTSRASFYSAFLA